MDQGDYLKRWRELFDERVRLQSKRADLETELSEISNQIAHINEVCNHLAPLAGVPQGKNISGLGITDAIRYVLENATSDMSPQEVRDALISEGFDLSGHSAPMASIYKILSRLAADLSNPIEREDIEGGRVIYRWKRDVITDDDIPF